MHAQTIHKIMMFACRLYIAEFLNSLSKKYMERAFCFLFRQQVVNRLLSNPLFPKKVQIAYLTLSQRIRTSVSTAAKFLFRHYLPPTVASRYSHIMAEAKPEQVLNDRILVKQSTNMDEEQKYSQHPQQSQSEAQPQPEPQTTLRTSMHIGTYTQCFCYTALCIICDTAGLSQMSETSKAVAVQHLMNEKTRDDVMARCQDVVKNVWQRLKDNDSELYESISKVYIGGSVGKGTALSIACAWDADVVFVSKLELKGEDGAQMETSLKERVKGFQSILKISVDAVIIEDIAAGCKFRCRGIDADFLICFTLGLKSKAFNEEKDKANGSLCNLYVFPHIQYVYTLCKHVRVQIAMHG